MRRATNKNGADGALFCFGANRAQGAGTLQRQSPQPELFALDKFIVRSISTRRGR
jgi:hypothetical protein